jgi:hypothetical protein
VAPNPSLIFPLFLWWHLLRELRRRGAGVRESGAFVLGRRNGATAKVSKFVFYDDIDPHALNSGIVRLSGHAMNAVWETCAQLGLEVLADVHTHPGDSGQSGSDKEHPMVSTAGHIALIVPNFARRVFDLAAVGHYRYQGGKRWAVFPAPRLGFFNVHFRGPE